MEDNIIHVKFKKEKEKKETKRHVMRPKVDLATYFKGVIEQNKKADNKKD